MGPNSSVQLLKTVPRFMQEQKNYDRKRFQSQVRALIWNRTPSQSGKTIFE